MNHRWCGHPPGIHKTHVVSIEAHTPDGLESHSRVFFGSRQIGHPEKFSAIFDNLYFRD